jgi:tetratricopeptide (TPR) repeat protein
MMTEAELIATVERLEKSGTSAQLANALDHLSAYYHERSMFTQAVPVYRRALGHWREILGQEHPSVGTLLANLTSIHLSLGQLDEATPLVKQALAIFETDVDFSDDGVIEIFERYIAALDAAGRIDEAEKFGVRVERIAALVHEHVSA